MGQLPFVCTKTAVAQDFKSKDCLRSYKAGTAVSREGHERCYCSCYLPKAFRISIGTGNKMVELCSVAISAKVCK